MYIKGQKHFQIKDENWDLNDEGDVREVQGSTTIRSQTITHSVVDSTKTGIPYPVDGLSPKFFIRQDSTKSPSCPFFMGRRKVGRQGERIS